ncbi:MAG TPA: DUF1464 domain-containing protein [Archaeoglobus profundus]|nr:DUF1464 domain-containing protein [Archaeoglobus profundus]
MIAVGIDAGTYTSELVVLRDGKVIEKINYRKLNSKIIEDLKNINADVYAGLSGYGLPVKRFAEISDKELTLMTLNFDETILGLRRIVEMIRDDEIGRKMYTIPAVIHLPTVPEYRKLNKIDMGTSDKICSVALAMYQLKKEGVKYEKQNFVLVEAGYGFNAFIAVKNGKIVDGLGGTSGFPSFSSIGAIDGELAYLLSDFPKSMLFRGGIKSYLNIDRMEDLPRFAIEWLCEYIVKGIKVVSVSLSEFDVIVSGRFFDLFYEEFVEFSGIKAKKLKSIGKQSAEGAAIIANGLAGGKFKELVDHLELRRAKGTILDYITPDIRKFLRIKWFY